MCHMYIDSQGYTAHLLMDVCNVYGIAMPCGVFCYKVPFGNNFTCMINVLEL